MVKSNVNETNAPINYFYAMFIIYYEYNDENKELEIYILHFRNFDLSNHVSYPTI